MQCAPSYFPGPWDAVIVPAAVFFSTPELRRSPGTLALVYGPAHLFRSAWLSGVLDYLKDPWTVDELYLRLRGPSPSHVRWSERDREFRLEGRNLQGPAVLPVKLSSAEADLLRILVLRKGSAVSRPILGWAAGCSEGRVIDTIVGRIRRKLRLSGAQAVPVSVRGLGYRLP